MAALDAGLGGAFLVEEFGEFFEHDAAQLLGVDDRHGTAVIAPHVVADADRDQLDRCLECTSRNSRGGLPQVQPATTSGGTALADRGLPKAEDAIGVPPCG